MFVDRPQRFHRRGHRLVALQQHPRTCFSKFFTGCRGLSGTYDNRQFRRVAHRLHLGSRFHTNDENAVNAGRSIGLHPLHGFFGAFDLQRRRTAGNHRRRVAASSHRSLQLAHHLAG